VVFVTKDGAFQWTDFVFCSVIHNAQKASLSSDDLKSMNAIPYQTHRYYACNQAIAIPFYFETTTNLKTTYIYSLDFLRL
jgi:hypothetical protein